MDPASPTAYLYRGEALHQLSRLDEALESLEMAAHIQPTLSRAYYLMGIVFDVGGFVAVERGDRDKSLAAISRGAASLKSGNSFLIFP